MHNENTEKSVLCPHCSKEDDCPHLLAVIDLTFSECLGGYACSHGLGELEGLIEEAFQKHIKAGTTPLKVIGDENLHQMWVYAGEYLEATHGDEDDDYLPEIEIDNDALLRLAVELLFDAGGEERSEIVDDEGIPGQASSMTIIYAREPKMVIDKAIENLTKILAT